MARFRLDSAREKQQLSFFRELKKRKQSAINILQAAQTQQVNFIATQKKQATQQQVNFLKSNKGGKTNFIV